ncbi:MAG TPA: ribosome recycling factor [Thermosynergistes sp.]|jgi:ribosome recycling factor|nr:ribosome recycling factor [Thermosynergistes sp.]
MPDNMLKELSIRMEKVVSHLREELVALRTARAHPALVEGINVEYYGSTMPIKQLATVTVPEPRQLMIIPWDKSAVKAIEKAIMASSLGVTPQSDGESIRLTLPELTRERRTELVKLVRRHAEDARVAIRNLRRNALEDVKKKEKDGEITEDDLKRYREEIQNITDEFIKKVDQVMEEKEKEIMEE